MPSWNGPYATRISRFTCSPRYAITRRTSRFRPSVSATDTLSRQPELKFCAVSVEKVRGEADGAAERPLRVPVAAELVETFRP